MNIEKLKEQWKNEEDAAHIPYGDAAFDRIINRHGSFHAGEAFRLLKEDGMIHRFLIVARRPSRCQSIERK